MASELEVILAELRLARAELERVNARLSALEVRRQFEPRTVTLKEAARLLSWGLTKAKQMVTRGDLETVNHGGRRMVPMSEIERLSTPQPSHVTKAQAKARASWQPIPKKKR